MPGAFAPEGNLFACSWSSTLVCLLHIFQEQTIFWVGKAQPFPLEQTQKKFLNFFFFFFPKKLMLPGFRPGRFRPALIREINTVSGNAYIDSERQLGQNFSPVFGGSWKGEKHPGGDVS